MSLSSDALIQVEEWKTWAAVDLDQRTEELVEGFIVAAQELIEEYCRRQFKNEVIVGETHDGRGTTFITVKRPPIVSIQELKIGVAAPFVTLSTSEYTYYADSGIIQIISRPSLIPPFYWTLAAKIFPEGENNVSVSYTGGPTSVPESVKLACKMQVVNFWVNRSRDPMVMSEAISSKSRVKGISDATGLAPPVVALLARHRVMLMGSAKGSDRQVVEY
jgi:hypothetical protein